MESRRTRIFKTAVIIGGNVGNLFAAAGFVCAGVWDWSGRFCRSVVSDYVMPNLNFTAEYGTFADSLNANYTQALSVIKNHTLPEIRNIVKPRNMDIYGIAGIFERKLNASFIEFKNETLVFFNQQSRTALLVFCTSTLSVKNIVQVSYAAGTLFGFASAVAYQYWCDSRQPAQQIEAAEVETAVNTLPVSEEAPVTKQETNEPASTPTYTPSATLFKKLDELTLEEDKREKRALQAVLRKTTKNLNQLSKN